MSDINSQPKENWTYQESTHLYSGQADQTCLLTQVPRGNNSWAT